MSAQGEQRKALPLEELICSFAIAYEDEVEVRMDKEREEEGVELRPVDVERLHHASAPPSPLPKADSSPLPKADSHSPRTS